MVKVISAGNGPLVAANGNVFFVQRGPNPDPNAPVQSGIYMWDSSTGETRPVVTDPFFKLILNLNISPFGKLVFTSDTATTPSRRGLFTVVDGVTSTVVPDGVFSATVPFIGDDNTAVLYQRSSGDLNIIAGVVPSTVDTLATSTIVTRNASGAIAYI